MYEVIYNSFEGSPTRIKSWLNQCYEEKGLLLVGCMSDLYIFINIAQPKIDRQSFYGPILDHYRSMLSGISEQERKRMLEGNWNTTDEEKTD